MPKLALSCVVVILLFSIACDAQKIPRIEPVAWCARSEEEGKEVNQPGQMQFAFPKTRTRHLADYDTMGFDGGKSTSYIYDSDVPGVPQRVLFAGKLFNHLAAKNSPESAKIDWPTADCRKLKFDAEGRLFSDNPERFMKLDILYLEATWRKACLETPAITWDYKPASGAISEGSTWWARPGFTTLCTDLETQDVQFRGAGNPKPPQFHGTALFQPIETGLPDLPLSQSAVQVAARDAVVNLVKPSTGLDADDKSIIAIMKGKPYLGFPRHTNYFPTKIVLKGFVNVDAHRNSARAPSMLTILGFYSSDGTPWAAGVKELELEDSHYDGLRFLEGSNFADLEDLTVRSIYGDKVPAAQLPSDPNPYDPMAAALRLACAAARAPANPACEIPNLTWTKWDTDSAQLRANFKGLRRLRTVAFLNLPLMDDEFNALLRSLPDTLEEIDFSGSLERVCPLHIGVGVFLKFKMLKKLTLTGMGAPKFCSYRLIAGSKSEMGRDGALVMKAKAEAKKAKNNEPNAGTFKDRNYRYAAVPGALDFHKSVVGSLVITGYPETTQRKLQLTPDLGDDGSDTPPAAATDVTVIGCMANEQDVDEHNPINGRVIRAMPRGTQRPKAFCEEYKGDWVREQNAARFADGIQAKREALAAAKLAKEEMESLKLAQTTAGNVARANREKAAQLKAAALRQSVQRARQEQMEMEQRAAAADRLREEREKAAEIEQNARDEAAKNEAEAELMRKREQREAAKEAERAAYLQSVIDNFQREKADAAAAKAQAKIDAALLSDEVRPMCRFEIDASVTPPVESKTSVICKSHASWFLTEDNTVSKSALLLTKARLWDEVLGTSDLVEDSALTRSWEITELTIVDDDGQILDFDEKPPVDASPLYKPSDSGFFMQFPQLKVLNLFTYSLKRAPYRLPGMLISLAMRGDNIESMEKPLGINQKVVEATIMPDLQVLDMAGCGLTFDVIPTNFFDRMPSLRILDMSSNNLRRLELRWMMHTTWQTLEKASFRNNKIAQIEDGFFHKFWFKNGLDMSAQWDAGSGAVTTLWPLGSVAQLCMNDDGVFDFAEEGTIRMSDSPGQGNIGGACGGTDVKGCMQTGTGFPCTWQTVWSPFSTLVYCSPNPLFTPAVSTPKFPCELAFDTAKFTDGEKLATQKSTATECQVQKDTWNCVAGTDGCSTAPYCRCSGLVWKQYDVNTRALIGGRDSQKEDVQYLFQKLNDQKERSLRKNKSGVFQESALNTIMNRQQLKKNIAAAAQVTQ